MILHYIMNIILEISLKCLNTNDRVFRHLKVIQIVDGGVMHYIFYKIVLHLNGYHVSNDMWSKEKFDISQIKKINTDNNIFPKIAVIGHGIYLNTIKYTYKISNFAKYSRDIFKSSINEERHKIMRYGSQNYNIQWKG